MDDPISVTELAEILRETGHRHHVAYDASNGVDPEWASWYAAYLQARIWDRMGVLPTRSGLVRLLIAAEEAFQEGGAGTGDWADSYAVFILDNQPV